MTTNWEALRDITVEYIIVYNDVDTSGVCWEIRDLRGGPYGRVRYNCQYLSTNRAMYFAAFGEIPTPWMVLHDCGHKWCAMPEHLYLGDAQDNADDAKRLGELRPARGDAHWSRTRPERLPRGDVHWSHLQPERLARGDANGARIHPERMARGDANGARTHPTRLARGDANGSRKYPERLPRGDKVVVNAMKRTCECGINTNPGAMGRHLKATDHSLLKVCDMATYPSDFAQTQVSVG